ncbi:MAG: FkbM family methyltransferase [Magnetococcales bacterium]|nr:FkbM family methyltransferase [Magnetococcales bacterium]MBF0323378.1 FkbM family methyltransferase [Magnetococcales bacterium]
MRLIGIAIVKNESDIIEVFLRHNMTFLDRLYLIDNDSCDTTMTIINRVQQEIDNIVVSSFDYNDHRQETFVTYLARKICNMDTADFILLLDADEFLTPDRATLEHALQAVPPGQVGYIGWLNYIPTAEDPHAEPDPRLRIRNHYAVEHDTYKAVLPPAIILKDGFAMGIGNHSAMIDHQECIYHPLVGVKLAHFPVRSDEQLVAKALIGSWALSQKSELNRTECHHWRNFARYFGHNFTISSTEKARFMAAYIGEKFAEDPTKRLVQDPLVIPEGSRMRWPEMVQVNLLQRVIAFANPTFEKQIRTIHQNDFMAIARTERGSMAYHKADLVVGQSLAAYGEWADEELILLLPFLKPGDHAIDAGANIGTHTIPFAKAVGSSGSVHAFEPQRSAFQMLCANAVLNGLINIHAHQAGLSDKSGEALVPLPDFIQGGNFANFYLENNATGEPVPVQTLDGCNLPRIRLIKMDVEGMEERVLRGGERLIQRDHPVLFVENNVPENSASLIRTLQLFGYRCFWHLVPYYNPHNYYGNATNIFERVDRPEINLLCVTEDTFGLADNLELVEVLHPDEPWQNAATRGRIRLEELSMGSVAT